MSTKDQYLKLSSGEKLLFAGDVQLTYQEFANRVATVASQLQVLGVGPDKKIVIKTNSYDELFACLLAAWRLGAAATPLNASLPANEQTSILSILKPDFLFGPGDLDDVQKNLRPVESDRSSRARLIMFTSGSTGLPKGCVLRFEQIWRNARLTAEAAGMNGDDRLFVNTPPYYMSALCHFLTVLAVGGSFVGDLGFLFGRDLLQKIGASRSTIFGGAPVHLSRVVKSTESQDWPSSLAKWISSGDRLDVSDIELAKVVAPQVEVITLYGLTEVSGRLCMLRDSSRPKKKGSVGQPLGDMCLTVRDANGVVLPSGQSGEIYVQGSMLQQGYFGCPDNGGLFATGDRGYVDAQGVVWHEGRLDDVFKSAGEKVSAVRIEKVLGKCPEILEAAVIAAEDRFVGTVPHAYIVVKTGSHFDKRAVVRDLKRVLPATHIPKKFYVVDLLPRTGSGKVRKGLIEQPALS